MYPEKTARLYTGRTKASGKVVDEWEFVSPFDGRDGTPKLPKMKVQVSLDKSKGQRISFVAKGVFLTEDIHDTDIEALRQKVEAVLMHQHDLLSGVTWENWLEIKVSGAQTHGNTHLGIQASLKMEYAILNRGVDPSTGRAYYVNFNGCAIPFPKAKKAGEVDCDDQGGPFKGLGQRATDTEYSYLPATPENLAALQDLQDRIEEVRRRMAAFLNQDTIEQFLANGANELLALPASA